MLEKFPLPGFKIDMDDSTEAQLDEDISLGEDDVHEIIEMTDEMVLDLSSDNENNTDSSMEDEVSSQENSFTTEEFAQENVAFLREGAARKDDAVYVFRGHRQDKNNAIFCCSLSENGQLAATGSQEDKAFLWNAVTGEIIIECTGFKDSVMFVGFNHNDAYLAVADMSGIIKVWQINTKTCVWETEIDSILWMEWHTSSNVLLAGVATGNLYMFKVPDGNCKVFAQGYGDSVETFVILPDGQRAAIGFKSGLIHIVDLRANTVLCSTPSDPARLHGHQYSVLAIDCHPTNNMLISGSTSGQVILSSASTGKILSLLYDPNPPGAGEEDEVSVEAVAFSRNPSLPVAAVAIIENSQSSCGRLLTWDIKKFTLRNELDRQRISRIAWTSTDVLFAAGLDGVLRSYDARAGKCLRVFRGHIDEIFDLYICEKEKKALTVSNDCTARIFDISSVYT